MQRFINLYQPQMVKYNINMIEWIILDYIMKANSWARSVQDDEWRNYFQVNAGKVLADLPALWIKTNKGITDKVKSLVSLWLLDRLHPNKPYFAPTQLTKDYYFTWHEMVWEVTPNGVTSVTKWCDNSNVNNSNVNYIYIPVDQVKEKSKKLAGQLEYILSSLYGETDLKDVKAIEIIKLRNSMSDEYKLPKVAIKETDTAMVKQIKKTWTEFKRTYTKEEFNNWLQNYLKDIKLRKPDGKADSYFSHRFSLFAFLTQRNWFLKFMVR